MEPTKLGAWRRDFTYELERLGPEWRERAWRYDVARKILNSPMRMAEYWRLAHSLDPASEPAGVIVDRWKKSFEMAMVKQLRSVKRALLMPGSFNPITNAHLALSHWHNLQRTAGVRLYSTPTLFVWSGAVSTIDKEGVERASWADRLAQLAAFSRAEKPFPHFVMLFNRGLYLDQMRALSQMLHPAAEITVLVGFDKIVQIFDPRYYADRDAALRELFAQASFLVAPRSGTGLSELAELLSHRENWAYATRVRPTYVPARFNALSSTQIRTLAATAPDTTELRWNVPPESYALIRETGAYTQYPQGTPNLYTLRQQWLRAIAGIPIGALRALPPLSELVRRAAAPDGAAMRRALEDGRWADDPEQGVADLQQLGLFRRKKDQDSGG